MNVVSANKAKKIDRDADLNNYLNRVLYVQYEHTFQYGIIYKWARGDRQESVRFLHPNRADSRQFATSVKVNRQKVSTDIRVPSKSDLPLQILHA